MFNALCQWPVNLVKYNEEDQMVMEMPSCYCSVKFLVVVISDYHILNNVSILLRWGFDWIWDLFLISKCLAMFIQIMLENRIYCNLMCHHRFDLYPLNNLKKCSLFTWIFFLVTNEFQICDHLLWFSIPILEYCLYV